MLPNFYGEIHVLRLRQQQKTMGAAIFYSPNNIAIEEIQFPSYNNKRKGVILKVNACAVCGYDVRVFRNGHQKVTPPIILGHEICGEVLQKVSIDEYIDTIKKQKL